MLRFFAVLLISLISLPLARADGMPACARSFPQTLTYRFINKWGSEKIVVVSFRKDGMYVSTNHWQDRELSLDWDRLEINGDRCLELATAGINGTSKTIIMVPPLWEIIKGIRSGKIGTAGTSILSFRMMDIGCGPMVTAMREVLDVAWERSTSVEPGYDFRGPVDCGNQVLDSFIERLRVFLNYVAARNSA
jgi:hypothetical protein